MQVLPPFVVRKNGAFTRAAALLLSVICVMVLLLQTVFARTTYVITDGDAVKVHMSYATNPETVLNEAGVELDEEDTYTTQSGEDGISAITVQRGQLITVDNCGEQFQICSYGESVGTLLDRLGIGCGSEYHVSESRDTETADGMLITVQRVQEAVQSYTTETAFPVTYCFDPAMPAGHERIVQEGVAGQKLIESKVVYVNGQEQSRVTLSETVLQEPVEQIIATGTGEDLGEEAPVIGDGVIVTASGEVLNYTHSAQFVATAYTNTDPGCGPITANGTTCRVGAIAVDPTVIPYGTRMFIVTNDGEYIYGICTAEDCGGAIKGNRVDLYFDTDPECWEFGVRDCTVYFLGKASLR